MGTAHGLLVVVLVVTAVGVAMDALNRGTRLLPRPAALVVGAVLVVIAVVIALRG